MSTHLTTTRREMPITRRIMIGFVVLVVLVVVLAGTVAGAGIWLKGWAGDYGDSTEQVQSAATVSEASASMVVYGMAEAAATDESSRAQYEAARLEKRTEAMGALDSLGGLEEEDAEDTAALGDMRSAFEQCDQALTNAVGLAKTDSGQALTTINSSVLPLASQLNEAAGAYLDGEQEQVSAGLSTYSSTTTILLIILLIVAGIAVALGISASVILTRMIGRQLRSAVNSISTTASELLAVASQVASSAAQTATATSETTATVEEVKQTAQLAHEKASLVAESSQNVAQVAGAGRDTVEDTVAAFERIQNQMAVVTDTIHRLSDQTQAVGDIITTVNDLAEQSNLLSVNASIEAAKAGDQGKGFTVVAQEVKSLAEQSKQAVSQVRTILSEIQKASTLAVHAAEEGQEAIEAGRHQIQEAGEGTLALADSATEAAQSAVQISASSQQQLAGMEQISQAIESIDQAGNQSAAGTRQVEQEVSKLQELALSLRRLVDSTATAQA